MGVARLCQAEISSIHLAFLHFVILPSSPGVIAEI